MPKGVPIGFEIAEKKCTHTQAHTQKKNSFYISIDSQRIYDMATAKL